MCTRRHAQVNAQYYLQLSKNGNKSNFHQEQNKLWSINYCTAMKINLLINKLGLNLIKLEKPESICINFINRKKCQNVFFNGKNVRQKS